MEKASWSEIDEGIITSTKNVEDPYALWDSEKNGLFRNITWEIRSQLSSLRIDESSGLMSKAWTSWVLPSHACL